MFGEMCGAREFRLVLHAGVLGCIAEGAVRRLERLVDVERENGRLDCLACEPLIVSEARAPCARLRDPRMSDSREVFFLLFFIFLDEIYCVRACDTHITQYDPARLEVKSWGVQNWSINPIQGNRAFVPVRCKLQYGFSSFVAGRSQRAPSPS